MVNSLNWYCSCSIRVVFDPTQNYALVHLCNV
jgi:hypothetical protein